MSSFPNSSFGGFKRRKAEQEKRDKEAAERKAKLDKEPKMSNEELQALVFGLTSMAANQRAELEDKLLEKRIKNGGW